VGEPDPAVELGVASQALVDAGHADQDHAQGVPVVVVPDLLEACVLSRSASSTMSSSVRPEARDALCTYGSTWPYWSKSTA